MKNYLMYNLQLLAYSAGYTVREMSNELGLNRNIGLYDPDAFAKRYEDRIKCFIRKQKKDWIMILFDKCKVSIVDKVDGCFFSVYCPNAFMLNINAIGYFLNVSWCDLAKNLGVSPSVISRMRDLPYAYDESRWREVYDVLMDKYAKRDKEKQFLEKATQYRILNKIPKNAFNKSRIFYMSYNETQDKI